MADGQLKSYLTELHSMTDGDTAVQVSMYEVGELLGLDRAEAAAVAEDLIIEGYAELVSLSGGISITTAGTQ